MNEHEQGVTTVSASQTSPASTSASSPFGVFAPAMEYMVDAAQRSVLFWDVMRRRGNQYREHLAETAPHVLDYEVELLIDGRTLDRPVNYCLVKVVPPSTVELDPTRRPFVIVDPRAGHGPGIGGFKADSEIGVAFKAGIPAISSASCRTPCRARPSATSRARRRSSLKRSSPCIPRPTASPVSSATARRDGRS